MSEVSYCEGVRTNRLHAVVFVCVQTVSRVVGELVSSDAESRFSGFSRAYLGWEHTGWELRAPPRWCRPNTDCCWRETA